MSCTSIISGTAEGRKEGESVTIHESTSSSTAWPKRENAIRTAILDYHNQTSLPLLPDTTVEGRQEGFSTSMAETIKPSTAWPNRKKTYSTILDYHNLSVRLVVVVQTLVVVVQNRGADSIFAIRLCGWRLYCFMYGVRKAHLPPLDDGIGE